MDQCFCHFNGFRVKDAEARKMIEDLTRIRETNNGFPISFWVGTREDYAKIEHPEENVLYILTDDLTPREYVDAVKPLDFTAEVTLEEDTTIPTGADLTEFRATPEKYLYFPVMNMVYFRAAIGITGNGKMEKGKCVFIKHTGGKLAHTSSTSFPVTVFNNWANNFNGYYNGEDLVIQALEDVEFPGGMEFLTISGWYFCDEE